MRPYLLIDFGSTYTKVTVVDAEQPAVIGREKVLSTVDTDITLGLQAALERLDERMGGLPAFTARLACSSAAGGLRIVAVGLVPELTAKASREAALGAGARVIATYSYRLSQKDVLEIERLDPDIVLLAGGTDGGNEEIVLHNGEMLAASSLAAPIVYAGNRDVRHQVVELLKNSGKQVRASANVMPRLHTLQVEPARQTIRELFLDHIIHAKGLDRVLSLIDGIVMPTPAAVLKAAELLSNGLGDDPDHRLSGIGPLAVIDVGGATTDVHTISPPGALEPSIICKGLEEPYSKRTVEGDLGMRVGAASLLEVLGIESLQQLAEAAFDGPGKVTGALRKKIKSILENIRHQGLAAGHIPQNPLEWCIDQALGRAAVGEAMDRHAGRLEQLQTPMGRRYLQYGKDLRPVKWLVGTGGVFVHSQRPAFLFADAVYDEARPSVLKPRRAGCLVDHLYLLAPMGLLAEKEPEAALELLRNNLRPVGS